MHPSFCGGYGKILYSAIPLGICNVSNTFFLRNFGVIKNDVKKDVAFMKRIGILTSGGDCQALNAAMRGVVKGICSERDDVESSDLKMDIKDLFTVTLKCLHLRIFPGF